MINVELDPRLPLPPVLGVEHKEESFKTVPGFDPEAVLEVSLAELEAGESAEGGTYALAPPQNVTILNQTARMTETGQIVIDVLVDVLDSPGAVEYEVRMAVG